MNLLSCLVMGLILFGVWLFTLVESRVDHDHFAERWPPIDDDEFLCRCPPKTDRNTALTVRRIMSESTGFPYENIYPDQKIVGDLGMG